MNDRIDKIISICEKYDVIEMYSFGSRSREVFRFIREESTGLKKSSSDIDIGVRYKKGTSPGPEKKVRLTMELEDFFGHSKIDLVQLENSAPFLALDIIRGELLYADDLDDQARYELFIMARAGDIMNFEMERRENILSVEEK